MAKKINTGGLVAWACVVMLVTIMDGTLVSRLHGPIIRGFYPLFSIILSLVVLSCTLFPTTETTLPFDAQIWKDATRKADWDTRRPMGRDLVQRSTLVSKTRDEVIQMLGQPQDTTDDPNLKQEKLLYSLGDIYSGEVYFLDVVIENDVVISTRIWNT